ncbi:MAG: hypothetical protein QF454_01900 [Candidatus Thalassarchaeaceae archaeon]|nr:hypothetical protein [Candidatus Thalassarchaeaceae archaeon]
MSEAEAIEPIRIDTNLWSHRELLERIVERYFHIVEEIHDVEIGWQIQVKEGDASTSLMSLNQHLRSLSWLAVLQDGSPYDLVILPDPPLGDGLTAKQNTAVWLVFTFFLTLAGGAWLQLQNGQLKLTDPDLLTDAFCWFALPIALVMFIGSESRRQMALRDGVDIGYHIPLAVPFLMTPSAPIWPFGVIGFTSQRRLDLTAFSERKSLATVAIIAPIIMLICGFGMTIIGYLMTPNSSPDFTSAPPLVEASILPEFVLSFMLTSEEMALRSAWLHPLGLAGIALSTMGWVLLLPLPGFPGDRLLSAILPPGEIDEGGTQTWLYIGILVAGIYVILNGGFLPWLMLIGLGAWRRFSPEASSTPFVLNEAKGFPDRARKQFSICFVTLLLLGFPGLVPVGELQDWDSGLDTSDWPTEVSFAPDESGQVEFPLKTLGVIPVDVEFQVTFTGREVMAHWDACGEYILDFVANCKFEDIGPLSNQSFVIEYESWTADLESTSPFTMNLYWIENLEHQTHSVLFSPSNRPTPAAQQWSWDGDWGTPQYCLELLLDEGLSGNLSIQSSRFSFSGESILPLNTGVNQTVCIDGVYGSAHTLWPSFVGESMEAPVLKAIMDDGTIYNWRLQIADQHLQMFAGAYPATELFHYPSMGTYVDVFLKVVKEGDPVQCPISTPSINANVSWQNVDDNGSWVWNLSEIPQGIYSPSSLHSEHGVIILPEDGILLICRFGGMFDYLHLQPYALAELNPAPASITTYEGMVFLPNNSPIKNHGNESVLIEVQQAIFGGQSNFSLNSFTLEPGEEWVFDTGLLVEHVNNGFEPYFWLETASDHWILHFVSHCDNSEGCDI